MRRAFKAAIVTCAALALVVCAALLVGCDKSNDTRVAGRVFDHEITEQEVIDYLDEFRAGNGTTDDEAWAEWIASKNTTPAALREEAIRYFAENWLVENAGEKCGVEVTDDEVQAAIDEQKEAYPSEIAWTRALINSGYTESAYRLSVKSDLIKRGIKASFADPSEVSDDELESYANNRIRNLSTKRTSAIFIESASDSLDRLSDQARAQQAQQELKSGAKFADVFAEYSDTTYSEDGDMGFDMFSTPSLEYRRAVNKLRAVGDVSDVVVADDGFFVIVVTDKFEEREGRSYRLKDFPEELLDGWRAELAQQGSDDAYNEFFTENVSEVDVAIEPMPEGLPYDVEVPEVQQQQGIDPADIEWEDEEEIQEFPGE